MGSEIIIPGTPIGDIPAYDRPNFDPKAQNGFLGSIANLATPPPGTAPAQRFALDLENQLTSTGILPKSAAAKVSLAAGATSNALGSSAMIGINNWPALLADVHIFLPAADTTAPVALKTSWNSVQRDLPAQQELVFENLDVLNTYLVNNDSVARTFNLQLLPKPQLLDATGVEINLFTQLGLSFGPQDVLRVRALTWQLFASGGAGFFGDAAVARLGMKATSPNTGARVFLLKNPWAPGSAQVRAQGSAAVSYVLETPVDILGTDFNAAGAKWNTPILRLEAPITTIGNNFDYSVFGLFDLYVGANQ